MGTWLLTWNTERWPWYEYKEAIKSTKTGSIYSDGWSCNTKQTNIGDKIYLIKLGKPPRGIIASGTITSEFYDSEHWNEEKRKKGETVRRVNIDFNRILDYDLDKILEQSDLKKMFTEQDWSPQGSGISIRNRYIDELEVAWDKLFEREDIEIIHNEYEDYLKAFERFRFTYTQEREQLEEKRMAFTKDYSMQELRHMSLDEYVVGKQDKTSFCYRLENELQAWGDMHGSTSAKFGIYFGKKGNDHIQKYRWTKGYGNTKEEALDKVKEQLVSLIMAGKNYDIEKINQNKLSPMMKGKLLSLYYPHLYLNIFSSSHLDYFIAQLNIKETKNSMSEIEKQKLLLDYKDDHPLMKNWSIFEFSRCLYYLFGSPTNENKKGVAVKEPYLALVDIFLPISKTEYEIIELLPEKFKANSAGKTVQGKKGKGNYEKQAKDNKRIGDRGELIVIKAEEDKLKAAGKSNLLVKHIAAEDDGAGYDILSYDEYGKEMQIEVKSTKAKIGDANFYLSDNELTKAKQVNNYWIYIVYEADTSKPKIWKIKNPFIQKDIVKIVPTQYKVTINVK